MERLGVQDELTALGLGDRGGDRDLTAELVGRPRLAFADALDFGRVQRIDFWPSLALVLEADPDRERPQGCELLLERWIARDLAVDVADEPAEAGAQELERGYSARL